MREAAVLWRQMVACLEHCCENACFFEATRKMNNWLHGAAMSEGVNIESLFTLRLYLRHCALWEKFEWKWWQVLPVLSIRLLLMLCCGGFFWKKKTCVVFPPLPRICVECAVLRSVIVEANLWLIKWQFYYICVMLSWLAVTLWRSHQSGHCQTLLHPLSGSSATQLNAGCGRELWLTRSWVWSWVGLGCG